METHCFPVKTRSDLMAGQHFLLQILSTESEMLGAILSQFKFVIACTKGREIPQQFLG